MWIACKGKGGETGGVGGGDTVTRLYCMKKTITSKIKTNFSDMEHAINKTAIIFIEECHSFHWDNMKGSLMARHHPLNAAPTWEYTVSRIEYVRTMRCLQRKAAECNQPPKEAMFVTGLWEGMAAQDP